MGEARFGVLGTLEVTIAGEPVEVSAMQLRRLLTRLVLSPGRPVAHAELLECMWPGDDLEAPRPADPPATLRVYASRLRRILPSEVGPHVDVRGYRVDIEADDVDGECFERLLSRATEELASDPAAACTELSAALALWRGPALVELRDEEWAVGTAVRLDELRLVAIERLNEARLALGDHAALCGELERLVDEHPLREGLWRQLMLALYRSGRQADALRAYQRLRERLGEDLGIGPSRELVELESAVLRQDPSLEPPEVRAPAPPARPVQAVAMLPAASGAAHEDEAGPVEAPAALPVPATSFVGRERETAETAALLAESRLVTLVGTGGAGKTRLSLQVVGEAGDEARAATRFVELAPLREQSEVVTAVAAAVGLRPRPGEDSLRALVGALAGERTLIVLDNCEHLVQACAELAEALLRSCPEVRILATSRERLGVDGEAVYRVPSLGVPPPGAGDLAAVAGQDAVRLFVVRAKAQRPSFTLDEANAPVVGSICRRLDGIPLAIELAAARLGALSLAQVDERLDERFRLLVGGPRARLPRQQTLRALIDWSYDLLDEAERRMLRRLSVFTGGFDLEIAETVLADEVAAPWDVLDRLSSLVDKSLVVAETADEQARYRTLETIRQYAADRLREEDGDAEVRAARDAHARAYLELAERAAPHLLGGDQFAWLDRLDLEVDNLRSALAYLAGRPGQADEAMRLVTGLDRFVEWRYHETDLAAAVDALARRPEVDDQPQLAARVHVIRCRLVGQADPARALAMLEPLPEEARALGDHALQAEILNRLAWLRWARGDYEESARLHAQAVAAGRASGGYLALETALNGGAAGREDRLEALALAREAEDSIGAYMVLCNLGAIALDEGDIGSARAYFEEALPIIEAIRPNGDAPAALLVNLGTALVLDGDHHAARDSYARALVTARRHLDSRQFGYGLMGLALCATGDGELTQAAALHGAAERQFERAGFVPEEAERRLAAEDQDQLRTALGASAFEEAKTAGGDLDEAAAVDLALGRTW